MAITEDMGFPRLTPPDDRMPSGRRLFRSPEELPDDQFDLLAAAWAENALEEDAKAELESVITAIPGKGDRAASFRNLRLYPGNEKWPGMHQALRSLPAGTALRRTIIPAFLAAAAVLVLVILGPAGAKLKTFSNPDPMAGTTSMTVAEIPGSLPIIRNEMPSVTYREPVITIASGESGIPADHGISAEQTIHSDHLIPGNPVIYGVHVIASDQVIAGNQVKSSDQVIVDDIPDASTARPLPLVAMYEDAVLPALAQATERNLATVTVAEVSPSAIIRQEKNWMLRSISFLAGKVTGKEKEIDGYMIATGCIKGINSLLGWEMELEQVNNRSGDPVAVNFSSSLLSFTKPVNKSTP